MIYGKIEDFLDAYKKLESTCQGMDNKRLKKTAWLPNTCDDPVGISVFWLETNSSDPDRANKLKICRMLRNYAQHNDDYKKFIAVSQQMVVFLQKTVKELGGIDKTAGQMCKKTAALTDRDNVQTACETVSKKPGFAAVVSAKTGEILMLCDAETIVGWITGGASLKAKIGSLLPAGKQKVSVVQSDVTYESVPEGRHVVVKADGGYYGLLEAE